MNRKGSHRLLLSCLTLAAALATTTAANADNLLRKLAPKPRQLKGQRAADMVVLSDLHLAEGRSDNGKWSNREQFRVHKQFDDMVGYLLERQQRAGNRKLQVVLNGDIFDFLLVLKAPKGQKVPTKAGPERHHSATEAVALQKLKRIGQQHAPFFASLRKVVNAGHEVVFTVGNHDQELHYPKVQRALRQLIGGNSGKAGQRVKVKSWFHQSGDVLVEHGHRYDALNNVNYPMHPFRDDKGTRRLRPAAGTYLVTEWANALRESMPAGLEIQSAQDLWMMLRRIPPELSRLFGFMAKLSNRTGPMDRDAAAKMVRGHRKVISKLAKDPRLLEQLNALRKNAGQAPLTQHGVYNMLKKFDRAEAKPYLQTKKRRSLSSTFRHTMRMLMPANIWPWLSAPARGSQLPEGLRFGLENMANVVVTGHTHHPYLYKMKLKGQTKQLANSGTWAHSGGLDKLTFVDIRQTKGKTTTVRLRRWNNATKRAGAEQRARRRTYKPNRFPGRRALN